MNDQQNNEIAREGASKALPPRRRRRDPVLRKRIIVEAAARQLAEEGMKGFTHRKIAVRADVPLGSTTQYFSSIDELREAALRFLCEASEKDLRDMADMLRIEGAQPRRIAALLHSYTTDQGKVQTESLLYAAALYDEAARSLVERWFEDSVKVFSEFVDEDTARGLVHFMDGVYLHACFSGRPADPAFLTKSIAAIMGGEDGGAPGARA